MSPAVETRPLPVPGGAPGRAEPAAGGQLTLAERLERVVAGLRSEGRAQCPVCGGPVSPAGAGGRCGGCGSSIG